MRSIDTEPTASFYYTFSKFCNFMHILNLVRNFDRSLKYPQCIQLFSTQKITRIKFYICMYKTEICQVHQYKSIIYDEKKGTREPSPKRKSPASKTIFCPQKRITTQVLDPPFFEEQRHIFYGLQSTLLLFLLVNSQSGPQYANELGTDIFRFFRAQSLSTLCVQNMQNHRIGAATSSKKTKKSLSFSREKSRTFVNKVPRC